MNDVFGGMVAVLTGGNVHLRERDNERFEGKASNAKAVAESWTDPDVRAERMTRESVQVTLPSGEVRTYRSTRDAFRELRLPDAKHIRFRITLKAERVHEWVCRDGRVYRFELVPFIK